MTWIKHLLGKMIAKGTSVNMERRNISCKHRLVVCERRKNNSEGSFLYLFNLVAKVHWKVVVPHFTCVLKNRSNTCAISLN